MAGATSSRRCEHFKRVSDHCARTADYNLLAALFTEDCRYIEHVFGEMDGRETVGAWIVPMKVVLLVTLIDS